MKKRLAIWIPGGIGNGNFSQGYPMLEKLVNRLSEEFEIFVYSQVPPNVDYRTHQFALKYPSRSIKSGKIRWLILLYFFFRENRKQKFNLVQAFWGYPSGFIVTILGKLLHISSIINVMGADAASIESIDYGIFHRRIPRLICSWTYRHTSALVCISEFQKKTLEAFGIYRDLRVIPWGVDSSVYAFSVRSVGQILRVIHVGHINPVKDQMTLLKAFALIRKKIPTTMKWFGLDCMQGSMQKFSSELGIDRDIEFMNMVPYLDMPQYYQEADIMLHTSLSEGQCMALTEAAATGVLMAGTNVGLLWDLGEQCGITVKTGDYESLANQVLDLVARPAEWKIRTERARAWSQNHTFDWTVRELTTVLREL